MVMVKVKVGVPVTVTVGVTDTVTLTVRVEVRPTEREDPQRIAGQLDWHGVSGTRNHAEDRLMD